MKNMTKNEMTIAIVRLQSQLDELKRAAVAPKDRTQTLRWDCPECGGKHLWTWKAIEVADTDEETLLRCDHCGKDQMLMGDGQGNFLPLDNPEKIR